MTGKLVVVTGGTSGIGQAIATEIARRGASVTITGRSEARTAAAAADITAATGNPHVDFVLGDLSEQSDVRAMAEQLRRSHRAIDVLVNNAGGGYATYEQSQDGVERTWALDFLAPFLLTRLLLDPLSAATAARVINIGSMSHRQGRIHWDDPNLTANYGPNRAYAQAKLALTMLTPELDRRLNDRPIFVATADPGPVKSGLFTRPEMANTSPLMRTMARFSQRIGKSPEAGAATTVWLASHTPGSLPSGRLWNRRGKETPPARRARATESQQRLWDLADHTTLLNDGARPDAPQSASTERRDFDGH